MPRVDLNSFASHFSPTSTLSMRRFLPFFHFISIFLIIRWHCRLRVATRRQLRERERETEGNCAHTAETDTCLGMWSRSSSLHSHGPALSRHTSGSLRALLQKKTTMTLSRLNPELTEMFIIPGDIVICDTSYYSVQHLPLSWQFAPCEIIRSPLL